MKSFASAFSQYGWNNYMFLISLISSLSCRCMDRCTVGQVFSRWAFCSFGNDRYWLRRTPRGSPRWKIKSHLSLWLERGMVWTSNSPTILNQAGSWHYCIPAWYSLQKAHRLVSCYEATSSFGLALSTATERDRLNLRSKFSGGGGLVSTLDDFAAFAKVNQTLSLPITRHSSFHHSILLPYRRIWAHWATVINSVVNFRTVSCESWLAQRQTNPGP